MLLNVRRLGRVITRGRRFIPEVDGLRFVAISAVVLYHLSQHTLTRHMAGASVQPEESWLPKLLDLGRYGVRLFFVLSGFLLALPFAKWRLGLGDKPSLRAYYLRRLTRLEPPYMVAMLLLFVGPPLVANWISNGWSLWPNLLASLVYQHNLIFGEMSPINPVTWSLEIEVQFYMLAPALAVRRSSLSCWPCR
jgi:peptidoglycan/LPS O-acetylase OafA/YrhL